MGFKRGDLSSAFAAQGISFAEPEAPAVTQSYDPKIATIDPNAAPYAPRGIVDSAAQNREYKLDQHNKIAHQGVDAAENAGIGITGIAQNVAGMSKKQRRDAQKKNDRASMMLALMGTPEFTAFINAAKDFEKALEEVYENQKKIDAYKDAIILARTEDNYADLEKLLKEAGHDTSGMTKEEILDAGMEELVNAIKTQADLNKVVEQKAKEAQDKLDALLEKRPELRDDPEFIEEFMEPHLQNMKKLESLIEAQRSDLDFVAAQENVVIKLEGQSTLGEVVEGNELSAGYNNTQDTLLTEDQMSFLEEDLEMGNPSSSYAKNTDDSPQTTASISHNFNAAAQNNGEGTKDQNLDAEASVSAEVTALENLSQLPKLG